MRPNREVATANGQTYFVTSNTAGRKPFFRHERWAKLFIDVLLGYRPERFLLHEFVVMPEHFHALVTPKGTIEKAVQFIKGGFSFRAKRELSWTGDIWIADFPTIAFGAMKILKCIGDTLRRIRLKRAWRSRKASTGIVRRMVGSNWIHSLGG